MAAWRRFEYGSMSGLAHSGTRIGITKCSLLGAKVTCRVDRKPWSAAQDNAEYDTFYNTSYRACAVLQ